jgi:hypothetical protein
MCFVKVTSPVAAASGTTLPPVTKAASSNVFVEKPLLTRLLTARWRNWLRQRMNLSPPWLTSFMYRSTFVPTIIQKGTP